MITKAERVPGLPKHHNLWSVHYSCGHQEYRAFHKPEPDPYPGGPGDHEKCPDTVQAPTLAAMPTAGPVAPVEPSSEALARDELIALARQLTKLAHDGVATLLSGKIWADLPTDDFATTKAHARTIASLAEAAATCLKAART